MLSLLAAILASAVALHIVGLPATALGRRYEILGSLIMGGGIAAMHFIGMEAMRVPARLSYDLPMVVLSVVLAIVISLVALTLTFRVRDERRTSLRKVLSAMVMGCAIPLMHYTGMAAARFSPSDKSPDLSHAVEISHLGIAAISVTSLLVLLLAIVTAFLDRLLAAQKVAFNAARESELSFRTLAEAIPQMIWTSMPDGHTDYVSRRWCEYTGFDTEQSVGRGWEMAIHSEDLPAYLTKWERSLQTGETLETEYRLRRASDRIYRWHLGRAVPIWDSKGKIVKWFGTCTDIDDQKRHQQILEEQIKERTAEVVAVRAQLTEEMREREKAQNELNQQNANMVHELTRRQARAVLLAKMGKLLQSSTIMAEAIPIVLGFAPKIFPEFRGALLLLNASRSQLEVVGTWTDCNLAVGTTFETDSCWALRTGQKHFVEENDATARCGHASTAKGSYLCIPIMTQGGAVGILHFEPKASTRELSETALLLVSSLVEQVGLSISNLKLQEALRHQSIRDALTGIFNRRQLEETLEREIRRAARTDQPVGAIMFDLDHFKTFNDTFGHEAGDTVLRELGTFLARSTKGRGHPLQVRR